MWVREARLASGNRRRGNWRYLRALASSRWRWAAPHGPQICADEGGGCGL
jgi:hypothetical protein